jgi:NADPH:quinone reductase-like Zn-dependent oxidoreductase
MRAALLRRYGGPEVMEVGEVATPVAGPGEVLVRVRAAALNHFDLWVRRGLPALQVPLPHVPGGDVVGVVAGLGAGLSDQPDLKQGMRVVVNPGLTCGRCVRCLSGQDNLCPSFRMVGEHTWGGQAEYLAVPAANVVAAPEGVSDAELASLPTVFMTVWQMLVDKAQVRPGDTVLVVSAGSGVGVAAVQIAKLFGARVIGTVSNPAKIDRVRALGADEVLDQSKVNLIAECKRLTAGRGIDITVEHAGGESFKTAVKVAGRGGRIVTCGATGDYEPALNLRYVFWRQISILGSTMAPKGRLHGILDLVAAGRLRGVVDRVMPLDAIADAHRVLEERQAVGKVILEVS